jgi:hypothetical protein
MGLFKDLKNVTKQSKELKKQAEDQGVDTSMRGMLASASGSLSQASDMLAQAQTGKAEGDRLRTEGVPAQARILAIRDTGMTLGGAVLGAPGQENPVADLDIEVSWEGVEPYRVTIRQLVPRLHVGRLVPGTSIPAKVDPLDHANLVLDWEAPIA